MDEPGSTRIAAGFGSLCMAVVALYGLLFVAFMFPQRPDPTIPDGDPCCTHPDTWVDVWSGMPIFTGFVLADAFLFTLSAGLACFMAIGSWPRTRHLLVVPGVLVTLTAIGVAAELT